LTAPPVDSERVVKWGGKRDLLRGMIKGLDMRGPIANEFMVEEFGREDRVLLVKVRFYKRRGD